jgi:hypothetical protein
MAGKPDRSRARPARLIFPGNAIAGHVFCPSWPVFSCSLRKKRKGTSGRRWSRSFCCFAMRQLPNFVPPTPGRSRKKHRPLLYAVLSKHCWSEVLQLVITSCEPVRRGWRIYPDRCSRRRRWPRLCLHRRGRRAQRPQRRRLLLRGLRDCVRPLVSLPGRPR